MKISKCFSLWVCLLGFSWATLAHTTPAPTLSASPSSSKPQPTDFVRFQSSNAGDQLQTANVTYRDDQGHEVTLIGAIHIADPAYYHQLNTYFQSFDVVLYELVGGPYQPEKHNAAKQQSDDLEGSAPVAMNFLKQFYGFLQTKLKLGFQLDEIDYTAKNFLHADVTHEEFAQLRAEKKESFVGLWLKAMRASSGSSYNKVPQIGLLQLLELLNRPGGEVELKRLLGRTFDEVEEIIGDIEKQGDTVILTERNRVLFEKLETVLHQDHRRIGIFYGSAHFVDLEKRLHDMGFKKVKEEWFTAWDLPPAPEKPAKSQSPATSSPATR